MSELAAFFFVNCLIVIFIRLVAGTADVLVYAALWGGLGCLVTVAATWQRRRRVA